MPSDHVDTRDMRPNVASPLRGNPNFILMFDGGYNGFPPARRGWFTNREIANKILIEQDRYRLGSIALLSMWGSCRVIPKSAKPSSSQTVPREGDIRRDPATHVDFKSNAAPSCTLKGQRCCRSPRLACLRLFSRSLHNSRWSYKAYGSCFSSDR